MSCVAYLITVNVYILCSYLIRLFNKGVQIIAVATLGKGIGQFGEGNAYFAIQSHPFQSVFLWTCHFLAVPSLTASGKPILLVIYINLKTTTPIQIYGVER